MSKPSTSVAKAQYRLTSYLLDRGHLVCPIPHGRGAWCASLAELCRAIERYERAAWERYFRFCKTKQDRRTALVEYAMTVVDMGPRRKPHRAVVKKLTTVRATLSQVNSDSFLQSYEWRRVRMEALKKYGVKCQCCGASPATGAVMNVDHIKPRKLFPQLALDVNNLQVLCGECNHGKGNWDMTDWRQGAVTSEREA